MPDRPPFGFLNVDKPSGLTSHDVVARVRRGLLMKKVGHAGTLDPLATGVLVLCLGPATRLSEYAMHSTKRYRARLHLGVVTTTWDAEGDIEIERDASQVTQPDVERALLAFVGDIEQVPPMYSAIKQGGRKLYQLARAGQTVARKPRQIRIDSIDLSDWSPPQCTLEVVCSAGTYIRSLAYDLGRALGVGAHLAGLVRTASGPFTLETAISLDTLLDDVNWRQVLLPADTVLLDWPAVHLDAAAAQQVMHGGSIARAESESGTRARAYGPDGALLALLKAGHGIWQPHKVFLSQ